MEDEEDDEEEEHATERRSFASVSTGSACRERSWSSLACSHAFRQLQTCLDVAELVLGLGAGEHGESHDSELSDDAFLRHQRPAQSPDGPSWRLLGTIRSK